MKKIVLIGPPASGKTTVLNIFKNLGYPTFSADEIVNQLYEQNAEGWKLIKETYKNEYIDNDFAPVNKEKIRHDIIYKNSYLLIEINTLIHPLVFNKLEEFWEVSQNNNIAIAEIPLFHEVGMKPKIDCDYLIGIYRSHAIRKLHLGNREWKSEDLITMEKFQTPWEDKFGICDLVIENNNLQVLEEKIKNFLKSLE